MSQFTLAPNDLIRFWAKVRKTDGCWEWTAAKFHFGHGEFRLNGKQVRASRVSYEMHTGPIPNGLNVNHHCDNPSCVRPEHLYVGTQGENMRDRDSRGHAVNILARHNAAKTHCQNGHELTSDNVVMKANPGGRKKRRCKTCYVAQMRASNRRYEAKHPHRKRRVA